MALWNKGEPKQTGDYLILLEDGNRQPAYFFCCQLTRQHEWSLPDGSYIYENIVGWMNYDGT